MGQIFLEGQSSVWQKSGVFGRKESHDSCLEAAKSPVTDWEQKTKDFKHWLNEYVNFLAIMLSSASARKRSELITITTLKNGCDSSILPAGFSAPTRIKGAMNGAKYKQSIGDSLLHSVKHLRGVQQLIFCSNNDLKYTVQWDQYWNVCRTKVRKNLT